jgi:hypothetical protein
MAVIPHPPYSPDLAPCDLLIFPKWNWSRKDAGLIPLRRSRPNRRVSWHSDTKGLPGTFQEETMGPESTCRRVLLRGWWRPIGLMVSFMIFTASVRNILGTSSYMVHTQVNITEYKTSILWFHTDKTWQFIDIFNFDSYERTLPRINKTTVHVNTTIFII